MLEWRFKWVHIAVNLPFVASLLLLMLADGGDVPLWCLVASLMHETGHVAAMLLWSRQPVQVQFGIFGMRMTDDPNSLDYRRKTAVLLAGPLVNLACAAVLWLTGRVGTVMGVHLIIGLFNLLPIESLDGGQALSCLLAMRGDPDRSDRMLFLLSLMGVFFLSAAGFTLLLAGGYNYTLLAVALYLGILMICNHRS